MKVNLDSLLKLPSFSYVVEHIVTSGVGYNDTLKKPSEPIDLFQKINTPKHDSLLDVQLSLARLEGYKFPDQMYEVLKALNVYETIRESEKSDEILYLSMFPYRV